MKKSVFKTALGWAGVAATESGIARIILPCGAKRDVERELDSSESRIRSSEKGAVQKPGAVRNPLQRTYEKEMLERAVRLLEKYFSGKAVRFDLPVDIRYYTDFQQAVWKTAAGIPFGETRSYSWIANRIKNPKAVRAVGQAMGANPVPIVVPCHRVIGASGSLCGFAGGLAMKKKLLDLESRKAGARKARTPAGLRA